MARNIDWKPDLFSSHLTGAIDVFESETARQLLDNQYAPQAVTLPVSPRRRNKAVKGMLQELGISPVAAFNGRRQLGLGIDAARRAILEVDSEAGPLITALEESGKLDEAEQVHTEAQQAIRSKSLNYFLENNRKPRR